jgi:hypothetical protein
MPPAGRQPSGDEITEMHRILFKVAGHETPTLDELAFLREIKIEVLARFSGPSMRLERTDDEDEPA